MLWAILAAFTLYHAVTGWEARYGCRCVMCRQVPHLNQCLNTNGKTSKKRRRFTLGIE